MVKIYCSNGWLFAHDIRDFDSQSKYLKEAGLKGVEIHYAVGYVKPWNITKDFSGFEWKSIHLPKSDFSESDDERLEKIKKGFDTFNPDVAVLHPNGYSDYFMEKLRGLPIALENLDRRFEMNDEGVDPKKLLALAEKYDFKVVIDIEHAWEHDRSMKYAYELFETVKHRLSHFHVSGSTKDCHHRIVCKSENKNEIKEFLDKAKDFPFVLEGKFENMEELKEEVEFLSSEKTLKTVFTKYNV